MMSNDGEDGIPALNGSGWVERTRGARFMLAVSFLLFWGPFVTFITIIIAVTMTEKKG